MTETTNSAEAAESTEEKKNPNNIRVTSSVSKTDREINFERNFGANLGEAVELFGENAVFGLYRAQAIIRCQSAARAVLDKPDASTEEAIAAGLDYTPGQQRRNADPKTAAIRAVRTGALSKDELLAALAELDDEDE